MYKLCKTEQSALRQRELENGLLEAMLVKRYEDIPVSDLCDQLQVPRKSFYRYFSSKDGAFHALLDHTMQECMATLEGAQSSREAFEQYFSFWVEQKPLLDALQRSSLSGYLVERTHHLVIHNQYSTPFQQHSSKFDHAYATLFLVSGIISIMIQWHHKGCKETPAEMALLVTDLLTTPLFLF